MCRLTTPRRLISLRSLTDSYRPTLSRGSILAGNPGLQLDAVCISILAHTLGSLPHAHASPTLAHCSRLLFHAGPQLHAGSQGVLTLVLDA